MPEAPGVMWVTLQGAFDGGHRDRYRCFCEGFSYLAQPGESYFELRGQTLLSFTNPVVGSQREIANIPRSSVRGVADDIDAIDPVPEADEEDDENRASLRRRFLSTSAAAPSSSNGVPEHWLEERLLLASRRARALPGDEPDSSDDDALMYTP